MTSEKPEQVPRRDRIPDKATVFLPQSDSTRRKDIERRAATIHVEALSRGPLYPTI